MVYTKNNKQDKRKFYNKTNTLKRNKKNKRNKKGGMNPPEEAEEVEAEGAGTDDKSAPVFRSRGSLRVWPQTVPSAHLLPTPSPIRAASPILQSASSLSSLPYIGKTPSIKRTVPELGLAGSSNSSEYDNRSLSSGENRSLRSSHDSKYDDDSNEIIDWYNEVESLQASEPDLDVILEEKTPEAAKKEEEAARIIQSRQKMISNKKSLNRIKNAAKIIQSATRKKNQLKKRRTAQTKSKPLYDERIKKIKNLTELTGKKVDVPFADLVILSSDIDKNLQDDEEEVDDKEEEVDMEKAFVNLTPSIPTQKGIKLNDTMIPFVRRISTDVAEEIKSSNDKEVAATKEKKATDLEAIEEGKRALEAEAVAQERRRQSVIARAREAAARMAERRQEEAARPAERRQEKAVEGWVVSEEAVPKAEARDKAKEEVAKDKKAEDKKNVKRPVIDSFGPVSMRDTLANTMINTAPKFEPLPVLAGVVLLVGFMLNT